MFMHLIYLVEAFIEIWITTRRYNHNKLARYQYWFDYYETKYCNHVLCLM
jgi:hypothetical protein